MIEITPSIPILKILLPIILPTIMSCSFLIAAIIVVESSGSDVPIATAVILITSSLIPTTLAIKIAESTTNLAPIISATSPRTIKTTCFQTELPEPTNSSNSSSTCLGSFLEPK